MEPASAIIERLGGAAVVAKITRTALTAPYRWQYARKKGGTGGVIPQRHHRALIDFARAHGIALCSEDFLPQGAEHRWQRPQQDNQAETGACDGGVTAERSSDI